MNSTDVLARVPGLTYRQLDHWCVRGFLGERLATPGAGYHREFTTSDLMAVKHVVRLMAAGLTLAKAWEVTNNDTDWKPAAHGGEAIELAQGIWLVVT